MNQKQRIFDLLAKTSKTQLSKAGKVKLSIADEAADAISKLEDALSELNELTADEQNAVNDITRLLQQAVGLASGLDQVQGALNVFNIAFDRANQVADNFKRAADTLGIDPFDSADFSALVESIEQSGTATFDAMRVRDQSSDIMDIIDEIQGRI